MSEFNCQKEVIKCVFVGDTGVGKTKLICSHVCGQKMTLEQLVTVHIPTVWAMDLQRIYNVVVDGVKVPYRPWDTFGDHKNDRCFAYSNANVVLICFSVSNKKSLQNVKLKWYPEVKRFCPNTATILVACKTDLRYMCLNHEFEQLMMKRPRSINTMIPEDMVYPPEGRTMAKEIGAFYYETSVLNSSDVDEMFRNIIRVAHTNRRRPLLRFTHTVLPIQYPTLQIPRLPPKPKYLVPNIIPTYLTYFGDELSSIFNADAAKPTLSDISIVCREETFHVHRLLISAGSETFWDIFVRKNDQKMIECKIFGDIASMETINNSTTFVLTVNENDGITKEILYVALRFLYTGTVLGGFDSTQLQKLKTVADILQIHELSLAVENIQKGYQSLNEWVKVMFLIKRNKHMLKLGLELGLFTDVTFLLQDNELVMAHKFILAARCEFMKSLLCNNFQEAKSSQVKLPDVSKKSFEILLHYFYTDTLPADGKNISATIACLELANRFFLPFFQNLLEKKLVNNFIASSPHRNLDEIFFLLEYAQLHNAKHLADWCLHTLSCNYKLLNAAKLSKLSLTNQNFIKMHRWPPSWYFEECEFYDVALRERQKLSLAEEKKKFKKKIDCLSMNPISFMHLSSKC